MWSLLTIALLVGAGLAVWRWRRPWLIYLFTAPIVVACGLFACESVAGPSRPRSERDPLTTKRAVRVSAGANASGASLRFHCDCTLP